MPNAIFTSQPTVTALDAGDNTATSFTGLVTLTVKAGTGTVGATVGGTAAQAAVAGVATFTDIKITLPGTGYVLTASAGGVDSADSVAFTVTQGPAVALGIQTQPGDGTAGSVLDTQPIVRILDGDGNVVTTATSAVTAVITGGTGRYGATLQGATTVNAVAGVATFSNLRIDLAAAGYTLTFATSVLPAVASDPITVSADAPAKLLFTGQPGTGQPSGGIAGALLRGQPSVFVADAYGNVIPGSAASVALAIKASTGTAGAVLGGTTPLNATAGVASFTDIAIDLAGTGYVLTASSGGLQSADSSPFDVLTSALRVQTGPANATGGTAFGTQPVFTIEDDAGTPLPLTDDVTVSIKAGSGTAGATLSGTRTVPATNGTATFSDLRINRAGRDYVLVASAPGHASVETAPFDVLYGAAVALSFATQPTGAVPGAALGRQPAVTVVDAGGNTVLTAAHTITIALTPATGTGGATLAGTKTLTAVNGRVTFFDLAINLAGTAYRLRATTVGGPTLADSIPIDIAAPVVVSTGGGGGGGGGGAVPTLTVTTGGPPVPTLPLIGVEVPHTGPSVTLKSQSVVNGSGVKSSGTVALRISNAAIPGANQVAVQPVSDIVALLEQAPLPDGSGTILTAIFLATLDESNQTITTPFAEPVELTLMLPSGSLPDGASPGDFVIAFWDGEQWVDLTSTGTFDDNGNLLLSADLEHFTPFAAIYREGGVVVPPAVSGAFASPPIVGRGGLALAVFNGGSVAQLEAAAVSVGARGVWVQDGTGAYHLLVVNGPEFVLQEFVSFFPDGFPTTIAVTITI